MRNEARPLGGADRGTAVEKSPEAFRTISEVAEDLDVPQHVLRFWETRFSQVKPLKRGGGRRYYRPDDVDLLKGIRYYLYGEGYTIKGVQRILKDRGIRHVVEIGRAQTENYAPPVAVIPRADDEQKRRERAEWPEAMPMPRSPHADPKPGAPADDLPAAPLPPRGAATPAAPPLPPRPAIRPLADTRPQDNAYSAESARKLQTALLELIECKRILDAAR
jgi:DNA-binding transcriptional MerR regulator